MRLVRRVARAVWRGSQTCLRFGLPILRLIVSIALVALFMVIPLPLVPWRPNIPKPSPRNPQTEVLRAKKPIGH
jgi:hypothetical protein